MPFKKTGTFTEALALITVGVIFMGLQWVVLIFTANKIVEWFDIPVHLSPLQWVAVAGIISLLKYSPTEYVEKKDEETRPWVKVIGSFGKVMLVYAITLAMFYIIHLLK